MKSGHIFGALIAFGALGLLAGCQEKKTDPSKSGMTPEQARQAADNPHIPPHIKEKLRAEAARAK